MKLLVTGGCGFIGAAFCRRIINEFNHFQLVNVDFMYPCSTISPDLIQSSDNYIFVQANLRDSAKMEEILRQHQIDTVIHFAAQSHVDVSFTNPLIYSEDNVLGTHSLLEACRKYEGIKRFIHMSTDEVYGESVEGDIKSEKSLLNPTNPYAASKAGAEMLAFSYMSSYNFPLIIIRSNNIYGYGQYPEKVIPCFILQLLNGQKLTIQGSGNQLRSFLHIEDAIDAILCVLFKGSLQSIYNISSCDEISILKLAQLLVSIIKPNTNYKDHLKFVQDRKFNDQRYYIDSKKLENLGWKQKRVLEKELPDIIKWYKNCDPKKYWKNVPTKTVLIWGSSGWIASLFIPILKNAGWTVVLATSRANCIDQVIKEIKSVNPSHLVSLIGRTHGPGHTSIDYLEKKEKLDENLCDNLYGPFVLGQVAQQFNLHLLYVGTGCIFEYDNLHKMEEGEDGIAFTEQDEPNFGGSQYSVAKKYTEKILSCNPNVLIARIRMPISYQDHPRNFISKIIRYKKICSIPNSMSVLEDLLPILEQAMEKKFCGILNTVNPGLINHEQILNWFKDHVDPSHECEYITSEELTKTCTRGGRSNNYLDTKKIVSNFGPLPHIQESVKKIILSWKEMNKLKATEE